ncbi:hypothetical protein F5Y08DRAFT_146207 [Xylaria arbuscula]|nr:hypothetical protein F5Y08DRAFT_146207 [Xylaria arbuscula]
MVGREDVLRVTAPGLGYGAVPRYGFLDQTDRSIRLVSARKEERRSLCTLLMTYLVLVEGSIPILCSALHMHTRYITCIKRRHPLQPPSVIVLCFLRLYVHLYSIPQSVCIPLPSRLKVRNPVQAHLRLCSTHVHSWTSIAIYYKVDIIFANLSFPVAKRYFLVSSL